MDNKKFEEQIEETRKQIKEILDDKNISQEQIERITKIDKSLDAVKEAHSKTEEELKGIKDSYIDYVKNNSSKPSNNEPYGENKDDKLNVNDNFNEILDNYLENKRK